MGDQWHYTLGGKQGGPVSATELKQMADSGELLPTDLVWKDGMAAWQPASALKGLFRSRPAPPPPPPVLRPVPPPPVIQPIQPPPRARSVRRAAREVFQGFQLEGNAQWWAFWLAVVSAAAAAYFTWQRYEDPLLTIGASVLAFCLGASSATSSPSS
jgi:hypothetical protein